MLNKNYLSSAAFYVFLMHSVSGSLSINISFTYWDWMGALRHSVLFIIQIGHLTPARSVPPRRELSVQHHRAASRSRIALFFLFHQELFFQHHSIALRLFKRLRSSLVWRTISSALPVIAITCRTFNPISPLPPFPLSSFKVSISVEVIFLIEWSETKINSNL